MSSNGNIRDRIAQNDVTVMRSYLEVDVAEWLSDNRISFGYEPFVIPSVVGPSREEWNTMVNALQAIGRRDFGEYDALVEGTRWEDDRPAEIMAMWEDIYDKHRLQEEQVTVEVRAALENFSKEMLLPDFVLYMGEHIKVAPEDFDWSSWDYILEVSGLWGVGLPGEASESEWWDWYRVSGVAFKELMYKMLGLWDDVYYLVPNQAYIEGVTDGIPKQLRNDEHYVIFNTTKAEPDLDELYDALGLSRRDIKQFESRLSPAIELVTYNRDIDSGVIGTTEYTYEGIDFGQVDQNEKAVIVSDDWVVYHGELGEVYVGEGGVHVRESQWRNTNMIMLREYVTDVVSQLEQDGIIEGLSQV